MADPTDPLPAPDSPPRKKKKRVGLTLWILGSIILAILFALVAPHAATSLHVGGEIFLRLLKMLVVPLVVTSVMSGILGLGDVRKLGKPGAAAVGYYITTTILAVLMGIVVVNVLQPGKGGLSEEQLAEAAAAKAPAKKAEMVKWIAEESGLEEEDITRIFPNLKKDAEPNMGTILENLMLMLVTGNLFESAAKTQLLPLIVFSIIFAGMLTTMGRRVATLTDLIDQANQALLSFILLLMKVAPIGIFCLVAARFGEANAEGTLIEEVKNIGMYMASVLSGLAFHAFITLPLIYWFFTRKNPYLYMFQMGQALLTAFSTASSSATLPVTMECAEKNAGVSKRSTEFVLPLGATINMDGTALYEAVAAIFIANAIGMELTLADQVIIAVTATLAAIGAAGIPEAGLVTMIIVLNAVNIPVEYIGLILSVDWLLDRFRTAVNVLGDAMGAAVVEKTLPEDANEVESGGGLAAEPT